MAKLIKKLKGIIPFKAKIILGFIKNINHTPYSLKSFLKLQYNSSDFFVFDRDCFHIGFIAENIRAILVGKPVDVVHHFMFFSMDGILINKQSYKTCSFFHKIIFEPINCKDKYISFIHYVESEISFREIFKNSDINYLKFSEQNRGYTIFYPNEELSGVVVHGNFGGISKNLEKMARQTILKHIYTPIYKFEENCIYDLVFNNPTSKFIFIKIIFNDSYNKTILKIPSMGTKFLSIKKYTGSVSFISNLPICRPLIFKNPTINCSGNFDVFHS